MKNLIKVFILILIIFYSVSEVQAKQTELTISAVQYPITANLTYSNFIKKIERYLKEAKKQGAELVVLPEYLTLDLWPLSSKTKDTAIVRDIEKSSSKKFIQQLSQWSKQYQFTIVGGTLPRRMPSGKIRNSAPVVFPNGKIDFQDKIFFTPWDSEMGLEEGTVLKKFKTPGGFTFYVLVCFDVEFPRLSALMQKASADFILVPSMTESKEGFNRVRYSAQARAVEQHSYVVVVGTVGETSKTWHNFGQAAFLAPQDKGYPSILKEGPFNEAATVTHTLDIAKLRTSRKKSGFIPAKKDRNRMISLEK